MRWIVTEWDVEEGGTVGATIVCTACEGLHPKGCDTCSGMGVLHREYPHTAGMASPEPTPETQETERLGLRQRWLVSLLIFGFVILVVMVALVAVASAARAGGGAGLAPCEGRPVEPSGGRCVNLGDWGGVAFCESRGNADARNRWSGADGLMQFLPSTWRGIAREWDRPAARLWPAPSDAPLPVQIVQAERLRVSYGIAQWECGHMFGLWPRRLWVTNHEEARAPRRCVRRFVDRWDWRRRMARSVCNV